ncbi:MAG TPA: hypothetical protein VGC76_02255 [Pyrinomonadaceae bacterium]|jgi:hypothetical protein
MKMLSEKQALAKLSKLKTDYRELIKSGYEHKAKSCLTCETKGACCLDAHFVNVHITRLEAVAIVETLAQIDEQKRVEIYERIEKTIEKYNLNGTGDTFSQTFACPLFEKGAGCLVHSEAKPSPCIQHACYENEADLPPDEIQTEKENIIENLNQKTYGANWRWLPLPVWISQMGKAE